MSEHYSKFDLNTYLGTPYFEAHIHPDYPLRRVLEVSRAFRRLPTLLRKLSELAKRWARRVYPDSDFGGIDNWYDDDGYELDPYTGKRLTDKEIDDEWERWDIPKTKVDDIPVPPDGFADPDTWEETKPIEKTDDEDRPVPDLSGRPSEVRGSALALDTPYSISPRDRICVPTDWGALRAVVVGRCENDTFAPVPWQPSVEGLPREGGVRYAEFAPEQWARAVEQLDALADLLRKEGISVYRPPLVPLEEAMARPTGVVQMYAREAFTVIGDTLIYGQCRSPFRRKESRAVEPLFSGHQATLRLPAVPDDIADSLPDDPLPYIEGGDVYRLGKDAIITMSGLASSSAGFRLIADAVAPRGITVWPAYLKEQWEHGDYVLMLVREGLCIACRRAFCDGLLPSPITDWDCIEITEAEADPGLAANNIVLRNNLIVMQRGNRRVVRALEKKGVDVIEVEFDGVAFFQGGIDCATNELWRDGDLPPPPDPAMTQESATLSATPPAEDLDGVYREARRLAEEWRNAH